MLCEVVVLLVQVTIVIAILGFALDEVMSISSPSPVPQDPWLPPSLTVLRANPGPAREKHVCAYNGPEIELMQGTSSY